VQRVLSLPLLLGALTGCHLLFPYEQRTSDAGSRDRSAPSMDQRGLDQRPRGDVAADRNAAVADHGTADSAMVDRPSVDATPDGTKLVSCTLTGPTDIKIGNTYLWSGTSTPAGYNAYWYGTKDGVPDALGWYVGDTDFTVSLAYVPGQEGIYTRYLQLRNANGTTVCTTNTITTLVHY